MLASTLGDDVAASDGTSREPVRTIDPDPWLIAMLRAHGKRQTSERVGTACLRDGPCAINQGQT